MKIRPIFKTIDIFSFIQFLSRQTNYIIKFFLLKVLYLVLDLLRNKGYTMTEDGCAYIARQQTQSQAPKQMQQM